MATLNPYLNFNGNTEDAFNFYRSVFGTEFAALQRFRDTPDPICSQVSPADADKIMHVALPIGKDNVLMGTDALESMGQSVRTGDNFSLSISADSMEEATRLFNALAAGGKVTMPLDKAFWGAYFGLLTDPFGVQWMVVYDEKYAGQESSKEWKASEKEAETTA
jgi:PhnB protein